MITDTIFAKNNINIFCDGSIYQNKTTGEYIGCPGYCVVYNTGDGLEIIKENYKEIIRDGTNNITENRAIYLSLMEAIYTYKDFNVNIFSDSQYCIFGLTQWIYSWINNIYNGDMYNSSGNKVANQEYIKQIVAEIYCSGVNINLFHQKGHVTNTPKSIKHANDVFCKSNGFRFVDDNFIETISYFNNRVDIMTKRSLDIYLKSNEYLQYNFVPKEDMINPISFKIDDIDIYKYKNQIKRRFRQ